MTADGKERSTNTTNCKAKGKFLHNPHFGTEKCFCVKKYKAYAGRNPKTGETAKVKPKKLPFFKCGKELRERVDY
jgi:nucleoid DNA-binding protein